MPTTPVYALPYPAAADPADIPVDMQELADRIALVLGGALSATPPASPFEGQLWAISPTAGVVWIFRYNASSASTYKWEFVGGPPLSAETGNSELTTGSATYVSVGPSITVPRAGDYTIENEGGGKFDAGWGGFQTIKLGAAAATDLEALQRVNNGGGTETIGLSQSKRFVRTLAAAATLDIQIRTNGGATARWNYRRVAATPIRVS